MRKISFGILMLLKSLERFPEFFKYGFSGLLRSLYYEMESLTNSVQQMNLTTYNYDPFLWEEPVPVEKTTEQNKENEFLTDSGSESDSNENSKESTKQPLEETCGRHSKPPVLRSQRHDCNVVGVTTRESQDSTSNIATDGPKTTMEMIRTKAKTIDEVDNTSCGAQDPTETCPCHVHQFHKFVPSTDLTFGCKLISEPCSTEQNIGHNSTTCDDTINNVIMGMQSMDMSSTTECNDEEGTNVEPDVVQYTDDDLQAKLRFLQVGEDVSRITGHPVDDGLDYRYSNSRNNLPRPEVRWNRKTKRRLAKRMKRIYKSLKMTPQKAEDMLNETCYIQVIRKILQLSGRHTDFDYKTFHALAFSQNFEHAFDNIEALNQSQFFKVHRKFSRY